MTIVKELFTEKFRPKTLNDLIAVPRIKNEFDKGLTQNLLLYGTAGTGKTSTLFIMREPHTHMYINASSEGRIDTIREDISQFCSSMSLLDSGRESLKCIVLDELDGASSEFFKAIRAVMEKFAGSARFIASCNYINKIPEPVQSRFNCVSFDPINNDEEVYLMAEYQKRLHKILKAAKIEFDTKTLIKFVKNDFPDMRSLLNKVQSFYNQGITKLDPKFFNINYNYEDLFKLCLNGTDKPYENYKLVVSEYSSRVDEALGVLGTDFPEYVKNNHPEKLAKLPMVVIALAEYQYQKSFAIDPMITLLATIFKIQTILS
jgi:replication factor C small subunit